MTRTVLFFLSCFLLALGFSCQSGQSSGDSPPPIPSSQPADTADRKVGFSETYEHTDRVIWQKPDLVIDLLGEVEGKTIADIGAGAGFFALRLSQKAEKVIAIDIDKRYITYLDSIKQYELPTQYQDRLETRLAEADDPHLSPGEADIVIIVNTYMYLRERVEYMRNLLDLLPEDGKVLIIDFKKKRTNIGPPRDIRVPLYQAEQELHDAGFETVTTNDNYLDFQYIILAEK